ncbi:7109_t:CDS:2, partial [Acaulospora morrowiae]
MSLSFISSQGFYNTTCGYCNSEERTSRKFYLNSVTLTCQDYQDLIDRGWRRSGTCLYKPDLRNSCCPQYTIRLDANKFQASKSQRKVVNRFNRFVEGTYVPSEASVGDDGPSEKQSHANGTGKTGKQVGKNFEIIKAIHEAEDREDYKHKFRIVLERSSFTQEKYQLYRKYQINIHKDSEDEVTKNGFRRFLVESPLQYESSGVQNTSEYGSFHQCYFLDDKMVAIAVLDILPKCVSSVYFLYDPDFGFLQLGIYSALREIALTKEYYNAGLEKLNWYYMGYYIHNCQKMKYKGNYKPSELLDCDTYEWYPFEYCARLLDQSEFVSFSNPPNETEDNKEKKKNKENLKKYASLLPPPGMLDPASVADNEIEDINVILNNSNMILPYH